MASLLLLPLHDSLDPATLLPAIAQAARQAPGDLAVLLRLSSASPPPARRWKPSQRLLAACYSAAIAARGNESVLGGWEIDVLFSWGADERGRFGTDGWANVWRVEGDDSPLPLGVSDATSRFPPLSESPARPPQLADSDDDDEELVPFPVVALGGSFDHLHPGHKILLSTALLLATRKLIVGVSSSALLARKAFASALEPLDVRMARAHAFCTRFLGERRGSVELDVCEITDVYGPTATVADVRALVLSRETVAGGAAVDAKRKENSLPPLRTLVIDLLPSSSPPAPSSNPSSQDSTAAAAEAAASKDDVAHKMSSTEIRRFRVERGLGP